MSRAARSPHAPTGPGAAAAEQITARLVVRLLYVNHHSGDGQATLFDVWRFQAFFTTITADTVIADKIHRGHEIIQQVHADLKRSAPAYLSLGRFTANAAGLVLAASAFTPHPCCGHPHSPALARARTATIRRTLITVKARIASSARRLILHLPRDWALGNSMEHPCYAACFAVTDRFSPNTAPQPSFDTKAHGNTPPPRSRSSPAPTCHLKAHDRNRIPTEG